MKSFTDLSLDIETYGTEPGCVILEIGLAAFSRYSPHRAMMTKAIYPSIDEQQQMGMKINSKTVQWWSNHPEAHKKQMEAERIPVADAVEQVHRFFRDCCNEETLVWAKGTHFDLPILRVICPDVWSFRNIHDLRTLKLVVKDPPSVAPLLAHSGVDDAVAQSREIQEICSMIDRVG
jgi:hypothetical protein